MVESITYKYINGNLAQEYATNWKVESQNLPSGSTIKTSEVPSQLTITVPANNTSSTRSGKIVLLQPASGKRITLNYSQVPQRYIISTKYFCVGNPDNGNYIYDANTETYETHVDSTISRMIFDVFKSDIYSDGSITVKKGNLSPSDFSGSILIELILGNKINGYVKRVMLRIKIN